MAPAQLLIDLDHQIKMEAPAKSVAERANGNFMEINDDGDLRCTNNCEDNTFDVDTVPDHHRVDEAGDLAVDIIDCADTSARVNQDEDPDATEYSSSFGNTMSGSDNGLNTNLSDAEVESRFCDDGSVSLIYGFDRMFQPRKKKLTAHWRRYIHPLMWRCKWIELRVKEFQSQASKYDKELSVYSQRKQYRLGQVGSENSAARLVPVSCQTDRRQVMKRRKRKRLEDTADLSSYMSHHSLFSYYENKKSEADVGSIEDDCGNQVNAVVQDTNIVDEVNYEWPVLESSLGDNSLEQVLWNIEVLQSRVFKIKMQIDKIVLKNAKKFSSKDNSSLFMPAVLPSGSAWSPAFSVGNVDEMPVALYTPPGHISEYERDLVMQESAVSSLGEAASLPDIIESRVGLLSSVDVSLDRAQNADSCADIDGDVLIHNRVPGEELQHFENVNQHIEMPQGPAKYQEGKESAECPVLAPERCPTTDPGPAPDPEPVLATTTVVPRGRPALNSCIVPYINVPRNKRKRAGRRGGRSRWNAKKVYTRRSSTARKNNRQV